MKLAAVEELKEIMSIFKKYQDIFPHIRSDKVLRQIESKNVVYEDGVVITFQKYSRLVRLGTIHASKGSWILHQIVNIAPQNKKSKKVLDAFLEFIDGDCYLTVRADNIRAIKFYEKNGFIKVGDIAWKSGTIPGCVYCKKYPKNIGLGVYG